MSATKDMRGYFDKLAVGWDGMCRIHRKTVAAVFAAAGIPVRGRVLDIGCGTGVLFPFLLEGGADQVCGIDLSPGMIAQARQKYGHPKLSIEVADLYDYNEGGFDLAVGYRVYPHFLDKERFARQVHRLLNPGGRLLIAHPEGREAINTRHSGGQAERLSAVLAPCAQEAERLSPWFCIDVTVDTPALYLLSGVKREPA